MHTKFCPPHICNTISSTNLKYQLWLYLSMDKLLELLPFVSFYNLYFVLLKSLIHNGTYFNFYSIMSIIILILQMFLRQIHIRGASPVNDNSFLECVTLFLSLLFEKIWRAIIVLPRHRRQCQGQRQHLFCN